VLLCFIDPRVRKIRNEASSSPGIFSRTLHFYYVASSPGSPLPDLDGHRLLLYRVQSNKFMPKACLVSLGNIITELEVPSDEAPGLMTLYHHDTNVLQSTTSAKSPYPPDIPNFGTKKTILTK